MTNAPESSEQSSPPLPERRSRRWDAAVVIGSLLLLGVAYLRFDDGVAAVEGSFDDLKAAGEQAHARGDLEAARRSYRDALSLADDVYTRINLGLVELASGDNAEASRQFERATELDPESPAAYLDLGLSLLREGRFEEAVPACRRAVELDPNSLDARHNLGYAYRVIARYDDAIEAYLQVLARDDRRTITHYELAYAYELAGRLEESRAGYRRTLALDPTHGGARARLATLEER